MNNITNKLSIDSGYIKGLRIATALGSVFAWCLSIWWSAEGFNISVDGYMWLGVGLGLFVTVSELLFNRATSIPTIWVVGLLAYIYGYGTNVAGIKLFLGLNVSAELLKADFGLWLVNSAITYGLAGIVEIAPEAFLLWAMYPDQTSFGDFVTSLRRGSGYTKTPRQTKSRTGSFRMQNVPEQPNRTVPNQNGTKPYPYRINWSNITRNTNIEKVLLAHREYWNKTGRECPNKTLVKETGVSKGQVSTTITKLKSNGFA